MQTPDITPAQVAAIVTFVGGEAVAWGLLNGQREQTIVAAAAPFVAASWKLADAIIRYGRSRVAAAQATAAPAPAPAAVAATPDVPGAG